MTYNQKVYGIISMILLVFWGIIFAGIYFIFW